MASLQSINEKYFDPVTENVKPTVTTTNSFSKYAATIETDGIYNDSSALANFLGMNYSAAIFAHAANVSFRSDNTFALAEVRKIEKEYGSPVFTILELPQSSVFQSSEFQDLCKYVYSSGFDAILIRASAFPDVETGIETVRFIRNTALGLRGRRVKIFIENCPEIDIIQECDGVVMRKDCNPMLSADILMKQKLLIGNCGNMTDVFLAPIVTATSQAVDMSSVTPLTTVPSSPAATRSISSSSSTTTPRKSFLFRELLKFLRPSQTRLIVCLSDDGLSASELSVQSRIFGVSSLPPILALSASESVARYMACLYGIIPLQTQSFISVATVVKNATEFAKAKGLVRNGDHVVVVTQPPPVTASTNESCFEGVVYDFKVCDYAAAV
jgi:hypothetical protein